MPHIRLEYSTNLPIQDKLVPFLQDIQDILAEILPAKLESFKSRAIPCQTYVVGDGKDDAAFVHCEIRIMPGRTMETLDNAAKQVLEALQDHFRGMSTNNGLSVEITELNPTYIKENKMG